MFTSRSRAIFAYPRCFSTLSQKSSRNPNLLSCILHPIPSSLHSRRSSNSVSLWNSGFASSRCISSIAPSAVSTLDWSDAVPGSETGALVELARTKEEEEEDKMDEVSKCSVRAYFVSTRFVKLFVFRFLVWFCLVLMIKLFSFGDCVAAWI